MRLHNQRYEQIKSIVVATFEKFGINKIPIDCFELAHKMGIQTIPFSSLSSEALEQIKFSEGEAFFLDFGEVKFIFYNDVDNDYRRQRFSILHEIGHCVLGHKGESELAKSEADFFARYAIAPIPLVWKTNSLGIFDIQNNFNTSFECATNIKDNYVNWIQYGEQSLKNFELRLLHNFNLL